MSFTNSLAMAVPAARQEECNRLMLAIGRGPNTFALLIRDKVTLAPVAYGAHTYDDELADCLVADPQTLPAGITLAMLQAHGFATVAAARTAAGYIRYRVLASRQAVANLKARLDLEGWEVPDWVEQ